MSIAGVEFRSATRSAGRWKRGWAGLVIGVVLLVGTSAQAFIYTTGDLVGVFVDGNSELIVNLGPVATLAPGATFDFETPPGFGLDGAIGGKFMAYATQPPFQGSLGRNVAFTAPNDVFPPDFDNNITAYVARLGIVQSVLEDGGDNDKFLELLNNFPQPPVGGVLRNTATELSIPTFNGASYTTVLGVGGESDRIDNWLPFETDIAINEGTNPVILWDAERTTVLTASTQPVGLFEVTGNLGGGTPTARVRFVPEPGAAAQLAFGGLALVAMYGAVGRRRREWR